MAGYDWNDASQDGVDPVATADAAWQRRADDDPKPDALRLYDARSWLARDIADPDFILGEVLSTTSRSMLVAPTGLGKTLLALGIGFHMAAGRDFMHWAVPRPRKILYIEGEMSRRLMKRRIADEAKRCGAIPENLTIVSTEDFPEFKPLNTDDGQDFIEQIISQLGGIDFIIFDNIMCLISGDMKEELPWTQTLPWIRSLSARRIGQLWVHHTGHNAGHSYGTSTREWQMDAVAMLERLEQDGAAPDVTGFKLRFTKHRERTPDNRADYAEAEIFVEDHGWRCNSTVAAGKAKLSPKEREFLKVLQDMFARDEGKTAPHDDHYPNGTKVVSAEAWRENLKRSGVAVDGNSTGRADWSKYRLSLKTKGHIGMWDDFVWLVKS